MSGFLYQRCPECHGTGGEEFKCSRCDGDGYLGLFSLWWWPVALVVIACCLGPVWLGLWWLFK